MSMSSRMKSGMTLKLIDLLVKGVKACYGGKANIMAGIRKLVVWRIPVVTRRSKTRGAVT